MMSFRLGGCTLQPNLVCIWLLFIRADKQVILLNTFLISAR
jgi:hypothetical protein